MSKRAEQAAIKAYPVVIEEHTERDLNKPRRLSFIKGCEQAEKDTIATIREQVEKWMPDNPEGDEHINGERVAFRSVLHLLEEMGEEKDEPRNT